MSKKTVSFEQWREFSGLALKNLPAPEELDGATIQHFIQNPGQLRDQLALAFSRTGLRFLTDEEKAKLVLSADGSQVVTVEERLTPPFNGAELIADGPGDEVLIAGINRIKLTDILTKKDGDYITFEEACNRGTKNAATNWGQRAAFALRDAGNTGKISTEIWPVGKYVVCPKTRWRRPQDGSVYAWCVVRIEDGFHCSYDWFGHDVYRDGRFVSLGK